MAKATLTILIFFSSLPAQFLWQDNGIPIRQGVHIEWQRTVAAGTQGTAIVVWSDARDGDRDVYAQKIDTSGTLLWGAGGVVVVNHPGRQEDPVAITDGSGGALVAWVDYRDGEESDIYLQHLDAGGQRLLAEEGVALCTQVKVQIGIAMCTDSLGGAYITWQDKRNGVDEDIYGAHIDSGHNLTYPGAGVAVTATAGNQTEKSIEYAGNHQALIVWKDAQTANTNIVAQRLNPDMSPVWTSALSVAAEDWLESVPRTTFMRGDTALVVWQENPGVTRLGYQLVSTAGLVLAAPGRITNDPAGKSDPRVKRDLQGNVFVTWSDLRNDALNGWFFTQKITPSGDLAWDSAGIALSLAGEKTAAARLEADGAGGAWYAWEQGVFPAIDVQAQHITAAGVRTLGDSGLTVIGSTGYQFAPILVEYEQQGTYVVFGDQGSGSLDLRVQKIRADGTTALPIDGRMLKSGLDGNINYVQDFSLDGESALIVWEDNRGGKRPYGLVVDTTGNRDNILNGSGLSAHTGFSEPVESEPRALWWEGTLSMVTHDLSSGVKLLKLNRLNINLQPLWDSTGIYVHNSSADQKYAHLLPAGEDIIVIWSEIRSAFDYDVFCQRFDGNGVPQLGDGGVALTAATFVDEYVLQAFSIPGGDFLIVWIEDVWGDQNLYVQRFTAAGTVAGGWPAGGLILSSAPLDQRNTTGIALPDGSGVLLVWEDRQHGTVDLYGQIVDWDGNQVWPANGIPITTAANDQTHPSLAADPVTNTALVVWEDFRNGFNTDIYGQLLDFSGPGLQDSNFAICDLDLYQRNPVVEVVHAGSFLTAWEDERGLAGESPVLSGGMDIYAQIVRPGYGFSYGAGGIAIVQEYHDQLHPQIRRVYADPDPSHDRWLMHWKDLRSSGKADEVNLYGQLLEVSDALELRPETALPNRFAISPAWPNPFNGAVSFELHLAEPAPVRLTIYNLRGQAVYQLQVLPWQKGIHRLRWNGRDLFGRDLSSGIYLYTVRQGDRTVSGKLTYLK